MTKQEKIAALDTAMRMSIRGAAKEGQLDPDGEKYHHFTDDAPKELKEVFMEHYEVRDLDFETFHRACDMLSEIYNDESQEHDGLEFVQEAIYERSSDSADIYISERLAYLKNWNEDEVADIMSEYGERSISTACAIWYDKQVEQAATIIMGWVNA